ncbi:hypothetical protein WR25_20636 [Diploscapter pachys]|uniref:G-protein coupled receptors family 1 profile domain-containing protein n=1 Tax=Diploscapter pachys TaxID=2018661 RepID=A0A2A2L2K9_9BILA|nr:hypothetical protein WR25_20636 [Diploscapter pachys]
MQTCSVFTVMMITIERWIAVCKPLQVRVWCTARKSRIALLVIFLCACVYNFVRFFEYKMVSAGNRTLYEKNLRDPEAHRVYYIGYYTILFILTHFLIPFTLMAVMNAHVIIVMWQGRRMRQTMTRQQQREQSTTVMLLIVTLIFVLCNTLNFVLNIWESIFPKFFRDEKTMDIAFMLNDLSVLLVIFNSATTFFVYFIFSEKYRQTLFFMLKNGCFTSISDYNNYTAMSRTASMRMTSEGQSSGLTRQGSKYSNSSHALSDMQMRPLFLQKRSLRATSEYNERTKHKNGLVSKGPHHTKIKQNIIQKDPQEIKFEFRQPGGSSDTIACKCNRLFRRSTHTHKNSSASDRSLPVMPRITITLSDADDAPRRNSDVNVMPGGIS